MSATRDWANAPAVVSREVLGPVDEPIKRYIAGIEGAANLGELQEELARWPVLAADAYAQATSKDFDWDEFQMGMRMERKGKFAGETFARKYGAILMPAATIEVALTAAHFHVPFGLAYLRLWETQQPKPARGAREDG